MACGLRWLRCPPPRSCRPGPWAALVPPWLLLLSCSVVSPPRRDAAARDRPLTARAHALVASQDKTERSCASSGRSACASASARRRRSEGPRSTTFRPRSAATAVVAAAAPGVLKRTLSAQAHKRTRPHPAATPTPPLPSSSSAQALNCDVLTAIAREEMYLRDKEREPVPKFYAGSSIRVTFRPNLDSDVERHSVRQGNGGARRPFSVPVLACPHPYPCHPSAAAACAAALPPPRWGCALQEPTGSWPRALPCATWKTARPTSKSGSSTRRTFARLRCWSWRGVGEQSCTTCATAPPRLARGAGRGEEGGALLSFSCS